VTTEESALNRILNRVVTQGIAALIVAAPVFLQPALAAEGAMSSSQSRMATCSAQNKGKKGDDYKKAQSDCLKGVDAPVAAAPMTQQQKMAMCSKQNKGKKGDDYKKAQSDCLKG
jgi:hypothetical protein